jgi:hypothetical protein
MKLNGIKYANRQPDMCRFLLHHGAEVDHVGLLPWRSLSGADDDPRLGTFTGTALETCVDDDGFDEDTFDQVLECRKLLLDHGCDPMTPSIYVDSPGIEDPEHVGPNYTYPNLPMCWGIFRNGDMVSRCPGRQHSLGQISKAYVWHSPRLEPCWTVVPNQ